MMSQEDPIVKPDYYFETRGMKHYEGGIPEPSWILKAFNNRQHGNFFIDERPIRELSPVKEEQRIRSEVYGGYGDINDGNRRGKACL